MVESFDAASALLGGALIGGSASLMLVTHGRVAGVSGILGGLLAPAAGDTVWRLWFVAGLLVAGLAGFVAAPGAFAFALDRSLGAVVAAGVLVGFGTRLGSGCTSGHGVCGNSRLSVRSVVATLTFIGAGIGTVYVVDHLLAGGAG